MDMQKATISVAEDADGAKVEIAYEDGYVVRMNVGPDSHVLRLYLGIDLPGERG